MLHANPDHLVSNVHYILRFRNKEKLKGEAGYYLSSLVTSHARMLSENATDPEQMGAIQFIENLDKTTLTISDAEFESNVETSISAIAEGNREEASLSIFDSASEPSEPTEEELIARSLMGPAQSLESSADSMIVCKGSNGSISVNGLLRTIQKPLTSMGRIFSDESPSLHPTESNRLGQRSLVGYPTISGISPALFQPSGKTCDEGRVLDGRHNSGITKTNMSIEQDTVANLAGQIGSEMGQVRLHQRDEHKDVVELVSPNSEPKWADDNCKDPHVHVPGSRQGAYRRRGPNEARKVGAFPVLYLPNNHLSN